MKRILAIFLGLMMMFATVGCNPSGSDKPVDPTPDPTPAVTTYIEAPYKITGDKTIDSEILTPVFYKNANGPTIGVTMLGVLKQGDKYFRDLNNNKVLDTFEDWRKDATTRATAMAATLSDTQLTHNLLNVMTLSPAKTAVKDVVDESGKPVWAKLMGNNASVATLDTKKFRNFVVRSNPSTEVAVWFNNAFEQYSEWDAIQNRETAVPFLSFTNPIGHGLPSSLGVTAAALGDGNANSVLEDAQMDGKVMWAKGIDGIYGPQIDLATDPRWSRNSGTYGERVDMAEQIARNLTIGYQNGDKGMVKGSALLTIKHFPGDGSAYNGFESHANAGRYRIYQTKDSLANYQLKPFLAAFEAGAAGVMPGYSQPASDMRNAPQSFTYKGKTTDILYSGYGNAFNANMTSLLREVIGFDGLINSDSVSNSNAHGVNENGASLTKVQQAALFASNMDSGCFNSIGSADIAQALKEGVLARAELRRAATQRLKPRAESGDLDNPYRDMEESKATVDGLTTRVAALAEETQLKSVVLLKNEIKNGTKALPLTDTTKKIYVKGYNATTAGSDVSAFKTQLTGLGYTLVEDPATADIAYLRVTPASIPNPSAIESKLAMLDLGEKFQTPLYNDLAKPVKDADGKIKTKEHTTVMKMDEFQSIATAIRAKGGKVIGEIVTTSPWILTEMEPYCDALIATFSTSDKAKATVVTGGYAPKGKLPITMIAHASVIAVETTVFANGEEWEMCVSPNDVPGYDKAKYMKKAVLDASPSKTYAYKDASGNVYWSNFGLTY